eukprot:9247012-Pyramimonas_sp.AAC.1
MRGNRYQAGWQGMISYFGWAMGQNRVYIARRKWGAVKAGEGVIDPNTLRERRIDGVQCMLQSVWCNPTAATDASGLRRGVDGD